MNRILSHEVAPGMTIRSAATGWEYLINNIQGGVAEVTRTQGPKTGNKYSFYLIEMARSGICKATGEPPIQFAQAV